MNIMNNVKNKKVHYTSLEPYPISSEIYNKLNFHTITNSNYKTFLELQITSKERVPD